MPTKRDISLPKGRQVNEEVLKSVYKMLKGLRIERDMLIEALHLIQDKKGYIDKDSLSALSEIFDISKVEVYEVASFYHHFDIVNDGETPPNKIKIRICNGLSCEIKNSKKLKELVLNKFKNNFHVQSVPCIGNCHNAPAAQIGKRSIENATKLSNLTKLKRGVSLN